MTSLNLNKTNRHFHKSPRQYQQKPESYTQNALWDDFLRAQLNYFLQTFFATNSPQNSQPHSCQTCAHAGRFPRIYASTVDAY